MTYGNRSRQCSGYCSGWQSFWLDHGEITGQLQALESAFNCLRGWRDVPPRNHDAAMPRNSHDGEGIHSRFAEPSKHCMAQRVEHKISREEVADCTTEGTPKIFKIAQAAPDSSLVVDSSGNTAIGSGVQLVYRCATAGSTLPVGSLTINAAACGTTTDTELRLK